MVWLGSLLLALCIFVYARVRGGRTLGYDREAYLGSLIAEELSGVGQHAARGALYFRPHGERAVAYGTLWLKRGHDVFIEKVFGRIEIEKGRTPSFFLKRIALHREELRGTKEGTIEE